MSQQASRSGGPRLGRADAGRIRRWIEAIDAFNSTPGYGTTRVLFTEPELAARRYVKEEMAALGLLVREDEIGNIFGTLPGTDSSLPPVWTGSHIDTVLSAGKFDGMTGVVGGMEALRLIAASGRPCRRDMTVVVYTSEEPTRFGLCCLGSRALAGLLPLEQTKTLMDENGLSLYEVLASLGYDLSGYHRVRKAPGSVHAAIELHIEQNSHLEKAGLPIGVVKSICAPTNYVVEVYGVQSHAGGTSMADRRDAYAASCEVALVLEKLAHESESEYTTATVGMVNVLPNTSNVIPGKVRFTIDIRDCDFASKERLMVGLKREAEKIAARRQVHIDFHLMNNDLPCACDPGLIATLEGACGHLGLPYRTMISGAYHDSMFVGRFAPVAMVFVPSKDGVSHAPEEWTGYEEIANGVDVLAETLLIVANQ